MTWWVYALLSAACWGLQYVLMETLFRRVDFPAAFSFLSLATGVLVAGVLWMLNPRLSWVQLGANWSVISLVLFCLASGTAAYLFNALAINEKNATLASFLEISYPLFTVAFTALFLGQIHLDRVSLVGAAFILSGSILVVFGRTQ